MRLAEGRDRGKVTLGVISDSLGEQLHRGLLVISILWLAQSVCALRQTFSTIYSKLGADRLPASYDAVCRRRAEETIFIVAQSFKGWSNRSRTDRAVESSTSETMSLEREYSETGKTSLPFCGVWSTGLRDFLAPCGSESNLWLSEYPFQVFGTFRAPLLIPGRFRHPLGALCFFRSALQAGAVSPDTKFTKRRLTMSPAQRCEASAMKA